MRRYWNTLGVAEYRAGDWDAAVTALMKSMELCSGGDPNDWLFLAMTHQQKGDPAEARRWYGRALACMEQNQPTGEELKRVYAEAAALLGVESDTMPTGPEAFAR